MPVALARCRISARARYRGRAWRDDYGHGWVGLTLGHSPVDGLAVVGAVGDHRAERAGDLVQQWTHLGRVALVVARQLAGEDLAAVLTCARRLPGRERLRRHPDG